MVPSACLPMDLWAPTSMWAQPGQGYVCGQRLVSSMAEGQFRPVGGCGPPSAPKLPSETREDRTKRLFRHYTVGSYDSLTSHRYRWGRVGRWARVGVHADGTSDMEGGQSWLRRPGDEEVRGGEVLPSPPLSSAFPRQSKGNFLGWAVTVGSCLGHTWGQPGQLCSLSDGALLIPPCFPPPVIMSLTTRWLSCRNGTTRASVLCSVEPKVMKSRRPVSVWGAGVSGWQGLRPAWGVSCLCPSSLLPFLPHPCPVPWPCLPHSLSPC